MPDTRQLLLDQLSILSEEQATEVLQFVQYLRAPAVGFAHERHLNYQVSQLEEDIRVLTDALHRKSLESMAELGRLRMIVDALPAYVAYLDKKGRYVLANRRHEQFFGLPVTQIEGRLLEDVLPRKTHRFARQLFDRCMAGESVEFEERFVQGPHQSPMDVFGTYQPFVREGRIEGVTIVIMDISLVKKQEQELRRLNELQNRLLSIISHDLKSPLHALQGMCTLLRYDGLEPEDLRHLATDIQRTTEAALSTLNNLLTWSTDQTLGPGPVVSIQLSTLISQKFDFFASAAASKSIRLLADIPEDLKAHAPETHLRFVIRNLIANAIKFTPAGGTVHVSASYQPDALCLTVSDTGVGIAPERLAKLWHPFERHTSSGTMGEKGTGLGLRFCKEFADQNGWSLLADSTPGQGSQFHLKIPVSA